METSAKRKTTKKSNPGFSCSKLRNAGTYSIVAYDPKADQIGVAVQSHWFAIGALVTWAEPGIGAVATQSFIEPAYGPSGLALMKGGQPAPVALSALLAKDSMPEVRQVAMIDHNGEVDAYTGASCIENAGHIVKRHFSVQANMMENKNVVPVMEKTFAESRGDLAERMLLTLEAAEAVGGDIRGRQAAAIIIVKSRPTGDYSSDHILDLRVDDNHQPLEELRRLVHIGRVYAHMNRGDDVFTRGDFLAASREYEQSAAMLPELTEARFWQAVALTAAGRFEEARPVFHQVFSHEPRWRKMVARLPKAGILAEDDKLMDDIIGIAT
jgi:uncharacterized Ntn-hydrolase superfamily protein